MSIKLYFQFDFCSCCSVTSARFLRWLCNTYIQEKCWISSFFRHFSFQKSLKLSSRDRFCSACTNAFPWSLNTCDSCRLVHLSRWLCETLEVRTVAVEYLQVTFTENWNGCCRLYLIFYVLVIDSNLRQESKLENDLHGVSNCVIYLWREAAERGLEFTQMWTTTQLVLGQNLLCTYTHKYAGTHNRRRRRALAHVAMLAWEQVQLSQLSINLYFTRIKVNTCALDGWFSTQSTRRAT